MRISIGVTVDHIPGVRLEEMIWRWRHRISGVVDLVPQVTADSQVGRNAH